MKFLLTTLLIASATAIDPLWEFPGDKNSKTSHDVKLVNDPVMGGQSNSDYKVVDDLLQWDGEVKIVPSLKAPGFANLVTSKSYMDKFPSAEGATHITLVMKTSTPDYQGFKVSVAANTINPQFKCHKADFFVTPDTPVDDAGYYHVQVPYTEFSNNWSSYTGEAIVKCVDDESVCPTEKDKKKIQQLGLWAEGAAGVFNVDLKGFYYETLTTSSSSSPSAPAAADGMIPLWTFDGENDHEIKLTNDPVMGGLSTSNYTVVDNKVEWNGSCEIVPSLKAPGFCNLESKKNFDKFPDATGATHITLLLASSTPDYEGFKFSFAANTFNPQFKSFKADFFFKDGVEDEETGFTKISIPFTEFSNNWSSYTGEAIVKCVDDESVCPKEKDKAKIQQLGLWTEGVEGDFNLEILGVYAETIASTAPVKAASCKVQSDLKFSITETSAEVGLPGGSVDESLSQAVCCDADFDAYPEPRNFYLDKQLFREISKSGVTTFYDSACGIPVFQAPVGRSFADFKSDTSSHGWPSFRGEEVLKENVVVGDDGLTIYSKCGTKLGTYETDDSGTRACIDLVCIAGNEQ
ncbi:hypothetical protein TrRE_jg8414 [Triparma retinervis]|uniref:NADH:ubiquinone oxidoreductase intermediate-associated protein 30 domain-containing protein n=1 Tax=Triparma retinervis TaxID=2557542 RepID=A0A9W7DZ09_9STRA|nr:hypothetical protein TrRE_jg8414 [Triparma retinervis]